MPAVCCESVAVRRVGDRDEGRGTLGERPAAQQRDAVLGDHVVDDCSATNATPSSDSATPCAKSPWPPLPDQYRPAIVSDAALPVEVDLGRRVDGGHAALAGDEARVVDPVHGMQLDARLRRTSTTPPWSPGGMGGTSP